MKSYSFAKSKFQVASQGGRVLNLKFLQEFASCERWLTLASTLLDKVKEDQTRALMKNRLDTMAVNTFYSQAKFENAAKIFENCFGTNSGNFTQNLIIS